MKCKKKKSKIRQVSQILLIVFAASLIFTPVNADSAFITAITIVVAVGIIFLLIFKYRNARLKAVSVTEIPDTETLLWRQISYQITDKLRGTFPEATWEFVKQPELNYLLSSNPIRIRTYNTSTYNFAEFRVDQYGHLNLELLTISSLKRKCDVKSPSESSVINPESWYSLIGKQALMEIIGDLQARGHQKLFISETGEIFIQNGDIRESRGILENFPPKSHWDVLSDILIQDELDATETENTLELSWS